MPMPMRGNRRDNQTDKNVERVQETAAKLPSIDGKSLTGYRNNEGTKEYSSTHGSDKEIGLFPPNSPLFRGDQDGRDYKVTYRFSYKTGGWYRRF